MATAIVITPDEVLGTLSASPLTVREVTLRVVAWVYGLRFDRDQQRIASLAEFHIGTVRTRLYDLAEQGRVHEHGGRPVMFSAKQAD
jgi:hypothetical protein